MQNTTSSKTETILSDCHDSFQGTNTLTIPNVINPNLDEVIEIFRDYEFPVSSWPVIISPDIVLKLTEATTRIPKLMRELPLKYFNNDLQRLADFYFNGELRLGERAFGSYRKEIHVSCRLDLALTSEGFKLLEINVGSAIGGWQVTFFNSIIRQLHSVLRDPGKGNAFAFKDTLSLYIQFLVNEIVNYVAIEKEVNLFISVDEKMPENLKIGFLDHLLKAELNKRKLTGGVYAGDIARLKKKDNKIFLDETRIHSLLVIEINMPELPSLIYDAFLNEQLYLPDNLGNNFVDDKRNLALLYQLAQEGAFSEKDNDLILDYLPWTAIAEHSQVTYKNQTFSLFELLAEKKNDFVLKPADGFQGKDVYVGKFLTDQEWKDALVYVQENGSFIVQEFCNSKDFLVPDQHNKWVPHKLIWGAFGFGNTYGGVWVRMTNNQVDKSGVINSANGAIEAIVYEHVATH